MQILEISSSQLGRYARVSIGFWVERIWQVEAVDGGLSGLKFVESRVEPAYFKDYDAVGPEEGPLFWPQRFDVQNWGFFLAQEDEQEIGGAAVAWNTAGVNMLEDRSDLAVLWDIRVHPEARGRGIGAALLRRAETWARERGCRQVKIETQNNNVAACRFYASMGCHLGSIQRYAYAGVPGCEGEVMLCWYKDLM